MLAGTARRTRREHPTHEPLVTREAYEIATDIGKRREGTRAGSGTNAHPQTRRTYVLRAFVHCEQCDRRMHGKTERRRGVEYSYYYCQLGRTRAENANGPPGHAATIRIPEHELMGAVYDLFARRVFGPHRHQLLVAELPKSDQRAETEWQARVDALRKGIAELAKRQDRLITQIEESDADDEFARRLRARFAELESRSPRQAGEAHRAGGQPAQA